MFLGEAKIKQKREHGMSEKGPVRVESVQPGPWGDRMEEAQGHRGRC